MVTALILPSEWLIRQFVSISLLYCSIGLYLEKNKDFAIATMLIALSIHYSAIVFIAFVVVAFLYKDVLPLKFSIPLFVVSNFFPVDIILGLFGDTLNALMSIDENSSYSSYVDRGDDFLNANASRDDFSRSFVTTVINIIFVFTIFYRGILCSNTKWHDKI